MKTASSEWRVASGEPHVATRHLPLATCHSQQAGFVAIVALVFLVILALLGGSAVLNNSFQERMAGNTRNRDLALQAAEAALKDAENTLTTWRALSFDGSVAGLSTYNPSQANDADYWRNTNNWASYRTPGQTLNQVAQQPRYRVERMPSVGSAEYYRVTARGVGGDVNAVVVVQVVLSYTP